MNLASTLRAHTRVALTAVAAAALLAGGAATATATPSPDARTGSPASSLIDPQKLNSTSPSNARLAATIPTTCTGVTYRTDAGSNFYAYDYVGQRFYKQLIGQLSFGGVVETPKTMAFATGTDSAEIFLAVRNNGSLWRVVRDAGGGVLTSQISASGWGGVRHITGSWTGTRLYALTTSGGLYRYSLTADGTPRSLGAIATTGWSSIKFLTATAPDSTYDTVIGVSTAGALRQYVINRSSGATFGGNLKASGWGQITHLSVGTCASSQAAPIVAIHSSGAAYGYYDANAYDLRGSDISGVGQIGAGFTGLMND